MAMKKGSKSGSQKKAATDRASGAPATSLLSLGQRVQVLEGHVADLRGVASLDAPVVRGATQPLTFKLAAGGPKVARLTLMDTKEIITLGSGSEKSKPRANGVDIKVLLEVWGNPGQQATIAVVNAVPTPMTSGILKTGYLAEVKKLRTQW
jgi:hypothetical protein